MPKTDFLVDIDLNDKQLLHAVIENSAAEPTGKPVGYLYHNTVNYRTWVYAPNHPNKNGTGWVDISSIYVHPNAIGGSANPTLTGANVLTTLTIDAEGHVDAVATRLMTLADLGFTGDADANNYTHPSYTPVDTGILTGIQVVNRVTVDALGSVTALTTRSITNADIATIIINDAATNSTYGWSSTKIANEIASAIAGTLVYKGGYNASTNTPNLDSTPSGIKQGYTYTVTVAGTFFSEEVQVGDMIIAEQDDPTLIGHWTVVNKNIPDIVDASETAKGIIEIATQAETDTGTDDLKAITPLKLKTVIDAIDLGESYSASFGDGIASTFAINHGLNTIDCISQIRRVSDGAVVFMQVLNGSATQISIALNEVPSTNQYRITIKK